ncbi:PhzF family phenazine biosynthesis protein [Kitasatospora sp. MAA4]|uniref:PhzF family phenazine biosynthesis protein n=1 Tax=Kitasatospora sp. MAA4 TaxID=3035093 RepID=UPI00247705C4|nr:PhzF family phenazine biosynthesis protein [Kitasatospora sp. MAA4]MDH6136278.1 PhzF family phenazine biosynthesis protein [Kitasatospora sp. MAA4]
MQLQIIDAFADRPFTGNPAAVCLVPGDRWPDESWMQQVAAELNLSETVFVRRADDPVAADWALRWFSPLREVGLCGHATLAAAHLLGSTGAAAAGTIRFSSRSGLLLADARPDGTIGLDLPRPRLTEIPPPDGLAAALGADPVSVHDTGTLGDLLVELADERTVRELRPDLPAIARTAPRGAIVTARGADPGAPHQFVCRVFDPAAGIPEDPVTGSAFTVLAPFWGARLATDSLTGLQASARTGLVHATVHPERVVITGRATTVLTGTLHAEPHA